MSFLRAIEYAVKYSALNMPLPLFVFVGSFLEEVISPIPSALIMGIAGSLALTQGDTLWYLLFLAVVGNAGKTLGAWCYYVLGDKAEDFFMPKATKWLGITHRDLENIGKRFVGHHWKDGGVLFILRLLPPFPTTPVSLAAGIIKMDLRVFLIATYAGNFFKDLLYLYAGYTGLAKLHTLWRHIDSVKILVDIAVTLCIIGLLVILYIHRGRGRYLYRHLQQSLRAWFHSASK
ncbi:MAG: VTT domain-containing protein [Candidatus Moranbacteria bacterium]|nr:VTT domain-containing protein [Candidatus Moranbacteria bacterium]